LVDAFSDLGPIDGAHTVGTAICLPEFNEQYQIETVITSGVLGKNGDVVAFGLRLAPDPSAVEPSSG
jgi:hypothetical protein